MGDLKPAKSYQPKGETFLLKYIYGRADVEELRGSPERVLAAIDDYACSTAYLMNVGADKGRIVSELIREEKPSVMVELGGYVGYSCVLFGDALRRAGGHGSKYYSLERNAEFAAVIMGLVSLAGLEEVVRVVIGSSSVSLKRLAKEGAFKNGIDVLFLDHYKPAYITDLKLCEELGAIKIGTVLAADNCISPGNPPYLEYVRATTKEKLDMLDHTSSGWDKRVAERSRNQYSQSESSVEPDITIRGRPEIVYESRMIESYEPTGEKDGIELTRCVGT